MKNLKTLRKNRGLTLMETAKQIGISQQMLSYYEMQGNPPIETIIKIANFFDCSVDYLLGHQTKNTLQLEGLNEAQRKIVELVIQLTPEQSWFVLGKVSDVLGLPYNAVKPVRPY